MRSFDEWVDMTVKAMENDVTESIFQEISCSRHETPAQSDVSKIMAQVQKEMQKKIMITIKRASI